MAARGATKGVFVTTSHFTGPARATAERLPQRLILIDGEELSRLLVRYGVGARSTRSIEVKKLDLDYFETEENVADAPPEQDAAVHRTRMVLLVPPGAACRRAVGHHGLHGRPPRPDIIALEHKGRFRLSPRSDRARDWLPANAAKNGGRDGACVVSRQRAARLIGEMRGAGLRAAGVY
jgi:hypothetical protein